MLRQQRQELVREKLGAAHVDEHDVRLDLAEVDLDARDLPEQRTQLARPPVVVRKPVDERVERDDPRGREDAGLVHARPAADGLLVRELDPYAPGEVVPIGAHTPC